MTLEVTGLRVSTSAGDAIVDDICLAVAAGELLGIIGESGSGKTTTALALLGFANPGTVISGGRVLVAGEPMLDGSEADTRRRRARLISYVPQDPGQALNPARRIGRQLDEIVTVHGPARDVDRAVATALERARLPTDRRFRRRYPFQLSGGQRQRVVIAQALLLEPAVIVLDEPTTGLDTTTRQQLITHLDALRTETGTAMVYVTHDVATIAAIADRIAVLYAGTIVEDGPAATVLNGPRNHYTRGLLDACRTGRGIPGAPPVVGARSAGCAFAARCGAARDDCLSTRPRLEVIGTGHRVRCRHPHPPVAITLGGATDPLPPPPPATVLAVRGLTAAHHSGHSTTVAADSVDLDIGSGACVALMGRSGAGKTTIGRCVAGLHIPDAGTITLEGAPLAAAARRRTPEQRRRIQLIHQSPGESLNPRRTIGAEIVRVLRFHNTASSSSVAHRVAELLDSVRLPHSLADRRPAQLSGGEQQRAAIARALAADPTVLVCDEITAALDVSVRAAVLTTLNELRRDLGLAILLITHDPAVVATIADRVARLEGGRIEGWEAM